MRESVLLQQYRAPFLELNIIWTSEPQDLTPLHRHRWQALATNRWRRSITIFVTTTTTITTFGVKLVAAGVVGGMVSGFHFFAESLLLPTGLGPCGSRLGGGLQIPDTHRSTSPPRTSTRAAYIDELSSGSKTPFRYV